MKGVLVALLAVASFALAGCGGGGESDMHSSASDQATPLQSARGATVDATFCQTEMPGYLVAAGRCHQVFTGLAPRAAATVPSSEKAEPAEQRSTVANASLFNWAHFTHPTLFSGRMAEGTTNVEGYGNFFYRHYQGSGNYMGVLNGMAYVYGPVTNYTIMPVGQVDDFYCDIYACNVSPSGRPAISWPNNANGVIVKDANGDHFAFEESSRCLYSYSRQQVILNFCLVRLLNFGSFAGLQVEVIRVRSSTGKCVAVLAGIAASKVDIYTDSFNRPVVSYTNARWDKTGCA